MGSKNKKQWEIAGHIFRLKPNTKRHVEEVMDFFRELKDQSEDALKLIERASTGDDSVTLDEIESIDIPDAWEQRYRLFRMVTEGPHEKIDFEEDLSADVLEDVHTTFLPPWMQSSNALHPISE